MVRNVLFARNSLGYLGIKDAVRADTAENPSSLSTRTVLWNCRYTPFTDAPKSACLVVTWPGKPFTQGSEA